MGGRAPGQKGIHRAPFPAPVLGTRRHLHTFRLARCSPFRPPRFQLLIWKRKKKPAGWGGRGEVTGAAAPRRPSSVRCRVSPNPRPPRPGAPPTAAPRPPAPPLLVCPALHRTPGPGAADRGGAWAGEKGPLRGRRPRPCRGRSPQEPSPPGSPPSPPRSPAWCQPPRRPRVNPSLSPAPWRGSSSRPGPCLQTVTPGFIGILDRETESQGGTVHLLRVRQPRLNS